MRPADLRRERRPPESVAAAPTARIAAARSRRRLLAGGVLVTIVALLLFAGFAPLARAVTIGPIDLNPLSPAGGSLGGLTGGIANVAVDAFHAIIKSLFAPVAKFITAQLIGWLIAVPNLTQGNVAQLEQTVEAMGGGLLGAVATISTIRYWAAGFAGGGDSGFAALEGLTRTVGAVLFLALWPWLFDTAVRMTNLLTGSLLGSGAVVHSVSHLLAAGLGAGIGLNLTPVGLFVDIAIAAAASLLFLGLLFVKIVVSISTILVFIGMPLAVVVWPVVPWIARMAVRAFAVCLLVPVLWALCFAGAAAVSLNALSFNGGTVLNTLLQPLVAIVLLWVTLKLPVHLARVAMLGAAPLGGGFASRAVSYAAGSQIRDTLRSHAPGWAGGQTSKTGGEAAQAAGRTGGRLRQAATLAGAAATGGTLGATAGTGAASATVTGGSSVASSTASGSGRAYTPPPTAQASAAGHPLQNGLQTPSFAGREQDFANEKFEAQYRERTSPVSVEQARAALAALPAETQRGIEQLASDHGGGAREHLAYQAMGEWSQREREALRTLAAASPDIRAEAVADTPATRDQANPPPADAAPGDGVSSERTRGAVADPPTTRPSDPRAPAVERPVAAEVEPSRRAPAPPRDPGPGGAAPDGDKG